jgi:multicomponent Na+:H+ antiporter subunit C
MMELFLDRYVYLFVLVLLAIGLYGMLAKRNLVQKIIGLTIFTTAIYLFFIEGSVKDGATAPVIDPDLGSDAVHYVDPLPHLLILTAIVVGVGIVGVALAMVVRIYRIHGTLDEDELVRRMSAPPGQAGVGATTPADGDAPGEDGGSENDPDATGGDGGGH